MYAGAAYVSVSILRLVTVGNLAYSGISRRCADRSKNVARHADFRIIVDF